MKFRGYWGNQTSPEDPADDLILCDECGEESQWFTLHERQMGVLLDSATFKLPCGHALELFEDVIPLRGQPA